METIAPRKAYIARAMGFFAVIGLMGAMVIAVAAVYVPGRLASTDVAYPTAMVAFGILGIVVLTLILKNQRLLIGAKAAGYQDFLGRRRMWTAAEIGTVVDAAVLVSRRSQPRRYIFFLGVDGRRLMVLNDVAWSQTAVDRLIQASGKTPQVRAGPVTPRALRREFPTTFGPLTANPYLVLVPVFVAVIAIAFGVSFGSGFGR